MKPVDFRKFLFYFIQLESGLSLEVRLQFLSPSDMLSSPPITSYVFSPITVIRSRLLQSPPRNFKFNYFPICWYNVGVSMDQLVQSICFKWYWPDSFSQLSEIVDFIWWIVFFRNDSADYCITDKDTWIALCTRHKLYTYNLYKYTHLEKKYNIGHFATGTFAVWQILKRAVLNSLHKASFKNRGCLFSSKVNWAQPRIHCPSDKRYNVDISFSESVKVQLET